MLPGDKKIEVIAPLPIKLKVPPVPDPKTFGFNAPPIKISKLPAKLNWTVQSELLPDGRTLRVNVRGENRGLTTVGFKYLKIWFVPNATGETPFKGRSFTPVSPELRVLT